MKISGNSGGSGNGQPSQEEVLKNIKMLQGPNLKNNIQDGLSGKTFSSVDALLNYYGYVAVK